MSSIMSKCSDVAAVLTGHWLDLDLNQSQIPIHMEQLSTPVCRSSTKWTAAIRHRFNSSPIAPQNSVRLEKGQHQRMSVRRNGLWPVTNSSDREFYRQ